MRALVRNDGDGIISKKEMAELDALKAKAEAKEAAAAAWPRFVNKALTAHYFVNKPDTTKHGITSSSHGSATLDDLNHGLAGHSSPSTSRRRKRGCPCDVQFGRVPGKGAVDAL